MTGHVVIETAAALCKCPDFDEAHDEWIKDGSDQSALRV